MPVLRCGKKLDQILQVPKHFARPRLVPYHNNLDGTFRTWTQVDRDAHRHRLFSAVMFADPEDLLVPPSLPSDQRTGRAIHPDDPPSSLRFYSGPARTCLACPEGGRALEAWEDWLAQIESENLEDSASDTSELSFDSWNNYVFWSDRQGPAEDSESSSWCSDNSVVWGDHEIWQDDCDEDFEIGCDSDHCINSSFRVTDSDTCLPANRLDLAFACCVTSSDPPPELPRPDPSVKRWHGAVSTFVPDGELDVVPDAAYQRHAENGYYLGNHPAFSQQEQERFETMLHANKRCFAYSMSDLPGYSGSQGPFTVALEHDNPILRPSRRFSAVEKEVQDKKCAELLEADIICKCPQQGNKYAFSATIAPKKDAEGNWSDSRYCVNYIPLNEASKRDAYIMQNPEDLFQRIGSATVFSKVDLRSGFHQIPVGLEDQSKLAFWWGQELWTYKRMPYGVKNGPAKFQRIMDAEIMQAGLTHCCFAFIDDLFIYSSSPEQHVIDVDAVLNMLYQVGLRAHPDKSIFGTAVVEYLGHNVSPYGLSPSEVKVAAIRRMKPPGDLQALQSLLGFFGYYRCYVPDYSVIASPLTALLSKKVAFVWGPEQQAALDRLKEELCAGGKAVRRFNPEAPIKVYTDWCDHGIGAVLAQTGEDGREYMCACLSRSLNVHEKRYEAYKGELLAVVWACKTLRLYLHGREFQLVTDHRPLTWLMTTPELQGQYARWALLLQEYDFKILHRPGKDNANADALSRLPQPETQDVSGARLHGDNEPPRKPPVVLQESEPCYATLATFESRYQQSVRSVHHQRNKQERQADWSSVMAHAPDDLSQDDEYHALEDTKAEPYRLAEGMTMEEVAREIMENEGYYFPSHPLKPLQEPFTSDRTRNMMSEGVTLIELFGGLGAGLRMLLRNNVRVHNYVYCDKSLSARQLMSHQLSVLSAESGDLLSAGALDTAFMFPQDVWQWNEQVVRKLVGKTKGPWLVVAGWECQDLSLAGSGMGLQGKRSGTFRGLIDILHLLHKAVAPGKLGYIVENTAFQFNNRHESVRLDDFEEVCSVLGQPVVLDAARFGSYAHRLRNFWTNLGDPVLLSQMAEKVERTPGRFAEHVLLPGAKVQEVNRPDVEPYYVCNRVNRTREAFPTLMATPASYAFRDKGPGTVWDEPVQAYRELLPRERELAMGYPCGATYAPGLTSLQRHRITGAAMDAYCLDGLFALIMGFANAYVVTTPFKSPDSWSVASALSMAPCDTSSEPSATTGYTTRLLAILATEEELGIGDIWQDPNSLTYLLHGTHLSSATASDQRRAQRRAKQYQYDGKMVFRLMPSGERLRVPEPAARERLAMEMHNTTGHFGRRRTINLLMTKYWWHDLPATVDRLVSACPACNRVGARFTVRSPQLHPLPIEGLFYRWGVDLAGPFGKSKRGNQYVMVCVEHYSKFMVLVPLPDKTAATVAMAWKLAVLGIFGSCAEVLTDNGTEFKGEFDELLRDSLIDHRLTSAGHPQSDGLAERAVQTIKRSLDKIVLSGAESLSWDYYLPNIQLGYNGSAQQSSGISPYYAMFGRLPTIPPAIRDRLDQPLMMDGSSRAADQLLLRAEDIRRHSILAGEALKVAQHRDTLQYARVRGGGYHPKVRKFEVGDFVYVRPAGEDTKRNLAPLASNLILRVSQVNPSGVLILQGKDGLTAPYQQTRCAPCHLANIDPTIDHTLARPSKKWPCQGCKQYE